MNAETFGINDYRDWERGACMWSWDDEWCGKPCLVEGYQGRLNPPDNYRYGARYGLNIPDGIPEYTSIWICDDHRLAFLQLNWRDDEFGGSIWQLDHRGEGRRLEKPKPLREVSVRIRTEMSREFLSATIASQLNAWMRENEQIDGWSHLKVVEVGE